MLVPGPVKACALPLDVVRPECLVLALHVVLDDRGGQREDALRGAVVLLQPDDLRAREVVLEIENVADVGAAETIDRLIGITDTADVPVLGRQQSEDQVLGTVGVLVLVDQNVTPQTAVPRQHLGDVLEELQRGEQEIVEVDGACGPDLLLVA